MNRHDAFGLVCFFAGAVLLAIPDDDLFLTFVDLAGLVLVAYSGRQAERSVRQRRIVRVRVTPDEPTGPLPPHRPGEPQPGR